MIRLDHYGGMPDNKRYMKKNYLIRITAAFIILILAGGLIYLAFVTAMPELFPLLQNGNSGKSPEPDTEQDGR